MLRIGLYPASLIPKLSLCIETDPCTMVLAQELTLVVIRGARKRSVQLGAHQERALGVRARLGQNVLEMSVSAFGYLNEEITSV